MKVYGRFVFKISPKINKQKYAVYLGITVLVRMLNVKLTINRLGFNWDYSTLTKLLEASQHL